MLQERFAGRPRPIGEVNLSPDGTGGGNQREKKYYISRQSGLISSEPWVEEINPRGGKLIAGADAFEETSGYSQPRIPYELQQRIDYLPQIARLKSLLQVREYNTRAELQANTLLDPGLISVGDEYYTGWFLINNGQEDFTYNRIKFKGSSHDKTSSMTSRLLDQYHIPFHYYFKIPNSKVRNLQLTIQFRALSVEEARNFLGSIPNTSESSLFRQLQTFSIPKQLEIIQNHIGSYDERLQMLNSKNKDEILEHMRTNLFSFAVYKETLEGLYKKTLTEVAERMKDSGQTVFQIGDEGCVIAYIEEGSLVYRQIPMPEDYITLFQRNRLKQKPFEREELVSLYQSLLPQYAHIWFSKTGSRVEPNNNYPEIKLETNSLLERISSIIQQVPMEWEKIVKRIKNSELYKNALQNNGGMNKLNLQGLIFETQLAIILEDLSYGNEAISLNDIPERYKTPHYIFRHVGESPNHNIFAEALDNQHRTVEYDAITQLEPPVGPTVIALWELKIVHPSSISSIYKKINTVAVNEQCAPIEEYISGSSKQEKPSLSYILIIPSDIAAAEREKLEKIKKNGVIVTAFPITYNEFLDEFNKLIQSGELQISSF